MGKSTTWLCFRCRRAVRRSDKEPSPRCPGCRQIPEPVGYWVETPKRSDLRAWTELEKSLRAENESAKFSSVVYEAQKRSKVAAQLKEARKRTPGTHRDAYIESLKVLLASFELPD